MRFDPLMTNNSADAIDESAYSLDNTVALWGPKKIAVGIRWKCIRQTRIELRITLDTINCSHCWSQRDDVQVQSAMPILTKNCRWKNSIASTEENHHQRLNFSASNLHDLSSSLNCCLCEKKVVNS